jgi:transposase-like protein
MTRQTDGNTIETVMERLIENGFDGFADCMRILLNEAMKIERNHALGAGPYERSAARKGHANGYKPKTVDTRMGRVTVDVPQVRGEVQFYPSALEKGCRSERALKLAIAEMYVKGISTRRVNGILEKMCGLEISSTQVSRVAALLDEELQSWRQRPLQAYPYLVLDAHYEKVRQNGSVCSCAVFTAIGINPDGKREILGVSVSLSEAEVHWRAFLKSLLDRGLHGVQYIVSDAYDGLQAALQAVFTGVLWQRCQFHLQRNAQAYAPTKAMQPQVAQDIRDIFNAPNGDLARMRLTSYVQKYAQSAPKLAEWMEANLPEGLTVFELPESHRKRMRTTNMLERLHEEINRRTRVARLFPNEASLLRLVSAVEMEISEDWIAGKRYVTMNAENENEDKYVNSNKKRIYRNNVA